MSSGKQQQYKWNVPAKRIYVTEARAIGKQYQPWDKLPDMDKDYYRACAQRNAQYKIAQSAHEVVGNLK
jgi:hypothetical protein